MTPLFITVAGIDGSGKTERSQRLQRALVEAGHKAIWTREPGEGAFGAKIRELLIGPERCHTTAEADLMLFLADRAEHVNTFIRPHLAAGRTVVCDRYIDSTLAYQGRSLGPGGRDKIKAIHRLMGWPMPDLTFLIDLPAEEAFARTQRRGGAETDPDLSNLQGLRQAYLEIFDDPDPLAHKVVKLDGTQPREMLDAEMLVETVGTWILAD